MKAEGCPFVTAPVRVKNRGFFPAEWISLDVQPAEAQDGGDLLVLNNAGANVLSAGSQGDLSVTLLTTLSQPLVPRTIEVTCYVFGRKQTVYATVQ